MASWAATLAAIVIERLSLRQADSPGQVQTAVRMVWTYPIKGLAVFFTAPFLAYRVARLADDPWRRRIAGLGLVFSVIAAWLAGTAVGTTAAALLIMLKIGFFFGIAFLVGTALSLTLSAAFSLIVLNATACFFLKLSSQEIVDHLRSTSA